jgi:adenine/guanine phosphoribosyltransferase-like PRPP-binding protein
MDDVWDGRWVADRLGITLDSDPAAPLEGWIGLALRRRSTRAHLLVSHVLGKHIPLDPRTAYAIGMRLGGYTRDVLDGEPAVVIGYAETATALGHAVADELSVTCLHSTRRTVPGMRPALTFQESHSHAPGHVLVPADPTLLTKPHPIVLVDDELSTGHTALNTIRALHELCPRDRYVISALVDVRGQADEALVDAVADELGTRIAVVSGTRGRVHVPAGVLARASELLAAHTREPGRRPSTRTAEVHTVDPDWPAGLPESGRHGFTFDNRRSMEIAARGVAARLSEQVLGDRVLVLGTEELMHAPMIIAAAMADWTRTGQSVRFSSTTRSPVAAIDEPGYPIRTALRFPAHEDGAEGERFVYNVAPATGGTAYTDIVLVVDEVGDTAPLWTSGGLVEALAGVCERLFVVTLPTYLPG